MNRDQRETRTRDTAGLWDPQDGPPNVDTRDVRAAYRDATGKPRWWRP